MPAARAVGDPLHATLEFDPQWVKQSYSDLKLYVSSTTDFNSRAFPLCRPDSVGDQGPEFTRGMAQRPS
eukprot:6485564-Lingulodinium_polyedra.AAC.1